MTETEINLDEATAPKSKTKIKPLAKVEPKRFESLARVWIAAAGGKGFMLSRKKHTTRDGYQLDATPMEWGAWEAWRKRKGLPTHWMHSKSYYMVPTQWPFQFDSEADEADDRRAGAISFDDYVQRQRT